MRQTVGPIILDVQGLELNPEDHEILQHPLVGGVIFFSRNYASPEQLQNLCQSIRQCRPDLILTVDQEGGRVQRFKDPFVRLPSMGEIGTVYSESTAKGLALAHSVGWLMAAELLSFGIDLSFAPVLDLNKERNTVIGDRAFSSSPAIVADLAIALIKGMNEAGMVATGKHFPGHGHVTIDSHLALPVDERDFTAIQEEDLIPFVKLINAGITAMMPAHILFPRIDDKPVGFSSYWLKTILRQQLQFTGVIVSDDLNMEGSRSAGNYADRALSALEAGCDVILICNNRSAAIQMLDDTRLKQLNISPNLMMLKGQFHHTQATLYASLEWKDHLNLLLQYRKIYENN